MNDKIATTYREYRKLLMDEEPAQSPGDAGIAAAILTALDFGLTES